MAPAISTLLLVGVLLALVKPSVAFGAGNIVTVSKIEGQNWRHGDIEDTLLQLAITVGGHQFSKLDVKRVYFGNWLRDYSQAIDVGGLKQLPADTIRIVLWILSFMTFGFATGEFEVTRDRLGCYRPEEHIDNPKDYADNEDARQYDNRLRGPVNEQQELSVDRGNGLKTYIASENAGCDTSAGLVRRLLEDCINLGRQFRRDKNKADQFEALRKLGTALHCLEDFSAHSNYTELALKELGVDPFVYVGDNTAIEVNSKRVFPVVTGTFGMTDFLHSIVGEVGDKVAQSEVEALESQLAKASEANSNNDQFSILKSILDKVPWGMLSGGEAPDTNQGEELKRKSEQKKQDSSSFEIAGISFDEAKAFTAQTLTEIYPILEWHDKIFKAVSKVVDKVPGLDNLLEDISGALTVFVFSLLAPYVIPVIKHARAELKSSSEGVLKSSMKGQYAVFEDSNSTDPTHSLLSKDHFSNILNPIAGQVASSTVRFVVPLIVQAWEDEGRDTRQVTDEVLQVFHHPALRDENRAGQRAMFDTVRKWWEAKDEAAKQDYRQRLSKDGVRQGRNHRGEGAEGAHGHSWAEHKKTDTQVNAEATISGLAGGLVNMVLGSVGGKAATSQLPQMPQMPKLPKIFGSSREIDTPDQEQSSGFGQQAQSSTYKQDSQSQSQSSGYDQQSQSASYGQQSSGYGQEPSSYGQESSGYNQESLTYGGRQQDSTYGGAAGEYYNEGRSQQSHRNPDSSYSSQQEPSYSQGSGYGRSERSQYGQEEGSRHGRNVESAYGRSEQPSYGRQQESSDLEGEYNSRRNNEDSGYGNSRQDSSAYSRQEPSSGYGGRNEPSGYGQETTYGRRGGGDNSYGSGNSGYGLDEHNNNDGEVGGRRHHQRRDNDEDDEDGGRREHQRHHRRGDD